MIQFLHIGRKVPAELRIMQEKILILEEAVRRSPASPARGLSFRLLHAARFQDDTIALMAKFKLAKGKARSAVRPQGGLPCVVFLILAMFLVMFILYYAMRQNANG